MNDLINVYNNVSNGCLSELEKVNTFCYLAALRVSSLLVVKAEGKTPNINQEWSLLGGLRMH